MDYQPKSIKIDQEFLEKLFSDESNFGRKYIIEAVSIRGDVYSDFGFEIKSGEDVILSRLTRIGREELDKLNELDLERRIDEVFKNMIIHIMINGIVHIRKMSEG